jgi:ABC-type glycerol-3-phosphate transport system permease component
MARSPGSGQAELPAAAAPARPGWLAARSTRSLLGRAAVLVLVSLLAVAYLMPFLWMLSTSLKTPDQLFTFPVQWIPSPVALENYPEALGALPFALFARNTAVITLTAMVGDVATATLIAFGFARLQFPGRDALFMTVLATLLLPFQVTMIPVFIGWRSLDLIDTFWPLIVPAYFGNPFYIFLMRQFFMTIPVDLEDAARVDGASSLTILWRVFVPLSGPAIATVAIFSFLAHWNDYFNPLIYLNSKDTKTLALGLHLFRGEFANEWNLMMAAAICVLLPCLIVFFLAQRTFVQGIVMTGLKE